MERRKIPERTCIACRSQRDKGELIRLVRLADGVVKPDLRGNQPGRGAYVCPNTECVTKALKERRFDRALRIKTPPGLAGDLEAAIQETRMKLK